MTEEQGTLFKLQRLHWRRGTCHQCGWPDLMVAKPYRVIRRVSHKRRMCIECMFTTINKIAARD